MTVWIDAQLSPALVAWLTDHFPLTVTHVRDVGLRGASDRHTFEAARRANTIVLTKDHDIFELVRQHGLTWRYAPIFAAH